MDVVKVAISPKTLLKYLWVVAGLCTFTLPTVFHTVPAWLFPKASPWSARIVLSAPAMIAGLLLNKSAKDEMNRLGTPAPHGKVVKALAVSGAFSVTRHPLYVAGAFLTLAFAFLLNSGYFMMAVVPWFAYCQVHVIPREERFLIEKFGDEYVRYKERVPKWLFFK